MDIIVLAKEFNLDLEEIVSIHVTSIFTPDYKIFFSIACEVIALFLYEVVTSKYQEIRLDLLVARFASAQRLG